MILPNFEVILCPKVRDALDNGPQERGSETSSVTAVVNIPKEVNDDNIYGYLWCLSLA